MARTARAQVKADRGTRGGAEGGVLIRALMPLGVVLLAARLALPAAMAMLVEPPGGAPEPARVVPAAGAGEEAGEGGSIPGSAAAALRERLAPLG